MAVTDQQKLEFLLKKIVYTKTKTGSVRGKGEGREKGRGGRERREGREKTERGGGEREGRRGGEGGGGRGEKRREGREEETYCHQQAGEFCRLGCVKTPEDN